ARTAKPSIAEFANGGTWSALIASAASTRPSASRMGTSSLESGRTRAGPSPSAASGARSVFTAPSRGAVGLQPEPPSDQARGLAGSGHAQLERGGRDLERRVDGQSGNPGGTLGPGRPGRGLSARASLRTRSGSRGGP